MSKTIFKLKLSLYLKIRNFRFLTNYIFCELLTTPPSVTPLICDWLTLFKKLIFIFRNLLTLPPIMSPGGFPVFDLDLTLGTTLNDSSDSQTLDFQILEHHLEILVKKVEQNHSIKRHRPSDEADRSEITLRMPKTLEPSLKSPKLTNKLAGTFPPELYAKWTEQPSRKDVILKTQSNPVNIQNPSLRQRIPTPIFPQAVKILRCQSTPPILSSCSSESGRLTIDQVADLIETRCLNVDGKETSFTRIKIIDARYQYEFDGGHIKGLSTL